MGATSFAQGWCSTVEQQCEAGWYLGLNHCSPVLKGGTSPVLFQNAPGVFVIHEECFLLFVLVHQKDIKRMSLKIPNLAKAKGKIGGLRGTVWFEGGGTGLRSTIPKP